MIHLVTPEQSNPPATKSPYPAPFTTPRVKWKVLQQQLYTLSKSGNKTSKSGIVFSNKMIRLRATWTNLFKKLTLSIRVKKLCSTVITWVFCEWQRMEPRTSLIFGLIWNTIILLLSDKKCMISSAHNGVSVLNSFARQFYVL